jgi:hypothetical protein
MTLKERWCFKNICCRFVSAIFTRASSHFFPGHFFLQVLEKSQLQAEVNPGGLRAGAFGSGTHR